ncbi:MAG: glycosyltransferase family 39 protein [Planctomycetia bacterium]|nr:glycosyltransferase family 39 protein [Planctomycetia bacterium]
MMENKPRQLETPAPISRSWWWEWEAAALGLLVVGIYFTRLTALPVCGEESRWASAAREMIASGDWVVPRQQCMIFPERPPLTCWAMGLVGLARHEVDLAAIRLPSAGAILILAWLIYAYARAWMSRLGSFGSAAAFITMGQVLQLGRSGESEAVFTLFTAASLLVWHWGYLRSWPMALTWSLGYTLAALGALTKGPQAPVYFVACCGAYLLWRRDWRWLLSRGHLAGLACFAVSVGAWLVPFAIASGWRAVDDIWTGLAEDRFRFDGLLRHVATYPFDTFGCLIPWSPLLCLLAKPSVRKSLLANRPQVQFLIVALVVTYPTVWFAAGAMGRYYMPLYPCLAVLIGLVIEYCNVTCADTFGRIAWRRYLQVLSVVIVAAGVVVVGISYVPLEQFDDARQPLAFLFVWVPTTVVVAGVLVWASLSERAPRPQIAVLTVASFVGFAYAGAMVNSRVHGSNDLAPAIAQLKQQLPDPGQIVSFDSVYHRFAYEYGTPIRRIAWPAAAAELPDSVAYFCFDHHPGEPIQMRAISGLPFEWDVVARINCDPVHRDEPQRAVIVGRIRRAQMAARPSVSRPGLR